MFYSPKKSKKERTPLFQFQPLFSQNFINLSTFSLYLLCLSPRMKTRGQIKGHKRDKLRLLPIEKSLEASPLVLTIQTNVGNHSRKLTIRFLRELGLQLRMWSSRLINPKWVQLLHTTKSKWMTWSVPSQTSSSYQTHSSHTSHNDGLMEISTRQHHLTQDPRL